MRNEQCNGWKKGSTDRWRSRASVVFCGCLQRLARNCEGKKGQKCPQSNIQCVYLTGSRLISITMLLRTPLKMPPLWLIWHFLPFPMNFNTNPQQTLAASALGLSLLLAFFSLTRPPWSWRWRDQGTCPCRHRCGGRSLLPCTPPPAPCCSHPWWGAASQPPVAARNSPAWTKQNKNKNNQSRHFSVKCPCEMWGEQDQCRGKWLTWILFP